MPDREHHRQIGDLFHQALALEPERRGEFLERACAGDEDLRREVESLIAAHERGGTFLEVPAVDVAARQLAEERPGALAGRRIGPYQIESLLGTGGMGVVYRARDTRLGRTVAIKVLPPEFSADPEQRRRFEREARAISQLNHPHVCTLYDVGQQNGMDFIVMEYLEGETLAARLQKGALPLDQVLRYAVEIADALDRAHRQGLVHRDLKPGNIVLTEAGTKMLDFGLAKFVAPPSGQSPSAALAPGQGPLTGAGMILGTIQYMAPEQLEGKEADPRTDIFAFGVLVYEIATGRRAFEGASQASLVAAILERDPPALSAVEPLTPPSLDRAVRKCLAKNPDQRWQTACDLRDELAWIAGGGSTAAVAAPVASRSVRRERLIAATAGLFGLSALVLLVALLAVWNRTATTGRPMTFSLLLPEGTTVAQLSLSPDGDRLAFSGAEAPGRRMLYVRPIGSLTVQPLSGTEGASYPFWSPDGRSIGFFADQKLKKIEASGGTSLVLCDAPNPYGGSWSRTGTILFAREPGRLYQVAANGGVPRPVTPDQRDPGASIHRWPWFLPDGRYFLYSAVNPATGEGAVYVGSLDSPGATRLIDADANPAFMPPRHLFFTRRQALMVQLIDERSLRPSGDPIPVTDRVAYQAGTTTYATNVTYAKFSVSQNGVVCYSSATPPQQFVLFDRSGRRLAHVGPRAAYLAMFSLSPDRKWLAVARQDEGGDTQIWTLELARDAATRITTSRAPKSFPIWSPDGRRIAYTSQAGATEDLYTNPRDGSGPEEPLHTSDVFHKHTNDWSPDGRYVLFDTLGDLWLLSLEGDRKPVKLFESPANESQAQFSPDGKWIAYASDESGRPEVWIRSFPGPGARVQVSTSGGLQPRWRADGKEIFYLNPESELVAVALKPGPSGLELGRPKVLWKTALPQRGSRTPLWDYAVMAEGQRFLVLERVRETGQIPVTVVLNWTAELRR